MRALLLTVCFLREFCIYIALGIIMISTCCLAASPQTPSAEQAYEKAAGYVLLEDNVVYENNLTGIVIRDNIPAVLKRCIVHSNGEAGLSIDGKPMVGMAAKPYFPTSLTTWINLPGRAVGDPQTAQTTISECDIYQNDQTGINVEESAQVSIEKSRIHQNRLSGIRLGMSGQQKGGQLGVRVSGNRIYRNGDGGIRAMPNAPLNEKKRRASDPDVVLTVVDNEIYKNNKGGIRVENNTRLTARGNIISDNGTGVVAYESAVLPVVDLYQNTVSFNNGAGIHLLNGNTGQIGIRNNWVFHNGLSGILCGLWETPGLGVQKAEIINNTVVGNGSKEVYGLQTTSLENQGAGIRNDSSGDVTIMNNIVAFNFVTGLKTKACDSSTHNLFFANGDSPSCCDDTKNAPYWIERLQVSGCPKRGGADLIADPMFMDPDGYDYRLKPGSPAVDNGSSEDALADIAFPPSMGAKTNDMGASGGPYGVAPWHIQTDDQ